MQDVADISHLINIIMQDVADIFAAIHHMNIIMQDDGQQRCNGYLDTASQKPRKKCHYYQRM